jgi:hypothetical protein
MNDYDAGFKDALDIVRQTAEVMAITARATGNYDRERAALDMLAVIERS